MSLKLADVLTFMRGSVLAAAVGCVAYSHFACSAPVPDWAVFNSDNSELPEDHVRALAPGPDGSLWAGTLGGGLARLDKDGRWQTYSKASTNGGLPNDDGLLRWLPARTAPLVGRA